MGNQNSDFTVSVIFHSEDHKNEVLSYIKRFLRAIRDVTVIDDYRDSDFNMLLLFWRLWWRIFRLIWAVGRLTEATGYRRRVGAISGTGRRRRAGGVPRAAWIPRVCGAVVCLRKGTVTRVHGKRLWRSRCCEWFPEIGRWVPRVVDAVFAYDGA